MATFLPRPQSTSDRIARGLHSAAGEGIPAIAGHLQQKEKEKKENEFLKRFTGEDFSGASSEFKKIALDNMMKRQSQAEKLMQKTTEQVQKKRQEEEKKREEAQGLSNALDWLDENIEYTGSTSIPFTKSFGAHKGGLNREAVEKREEYDATGFWAADQVFTHFNKGTISKDKLKVIKEELAPHSGLSERTNKARNSAMRRMANLPKNLPKSQFDKHLNSELNAVKKIEKHEGFEQKDLPPIDSFWE